MKCAWDSVLNILPVHMRQEVDRLGRRDLQELRLRLGAPPELNMGISSLWLEHRITKEDLRFCINTASRYSPWAASTVNRGYITAPGGHRIGLGGEIAVDRGGVRTFRDIRSVNIRIARDITGIAPKNAESLGSILCIGPPGAGKTTLLRDLARQISSTQSVCVADERSELFPKEFFRGDRLDVLAGCPKANAIDMLLRTMGPRYIAMDEITAPEDASALLHAAGCGVRLLATAHAGTLNDLKLRPVYKPLLEQKIFQTILILSPDQKFHLERIAA